MNVTPELLAQIQQLIAENKINADGRSPIRPRQLHNLTLAPTATDPRPLFIPSSEAPRDWDTFKTFPYPRLLWSPDGVEITVKTKTEHEQRLEDGYLEVAPSAVPVDPIVDIREALEGLSSQERELILNRADTQRKESLQAQIAALSPELLEQLLTQARDMAQAPVVKKRGGRPRKVEAA